MTLLITGGSGFVLSHLARQWLRADPAAQVVLLDANPLDAVAERFFAPVRDRLTMIAGDVRDAAGLETRLAPYAVTHLVHGAAVTSINRHTEGIGMAGARPALETNIMGTVNLLAWAGQQRTLQRFIYVSSGSVYGDDGPAEAGAPLPEEGYLDPEGFYDISKYTSELLTAECARRFGLPAVSVRFSGVYGPMDRETPSRDVVCVPQRIAKRGLAGETVKVNDLAGVGDFIDAGDIAPALMVLLQAERPRHQVYNVAYGATVSIAEMLEMTREKVPDLQHAVVPAAEADVVLDPALSGGRWGAYDISRLRDEFGWRPRPFRTAYHAYMDWLQEETAP